MIRNISDLYSIETLASTVIGSRILTKAYLRIEASISEEGYNFRRC